MQLKNRDLGVTIIGQTGMGKSAFLHNLVMDDIKAGVSSIVFDPHGDLVTDILESLPEEYADQVFVLSVDETMPFGLNIYECPKRSPLAYDQTVNNATLIFKRLIALDREFHPHIENLFRNVGYTLLANPAYTMAEINMMFELNEQGKLFRSHLLRQVNNQNVRSFWQGVEGRRGNDAYRHVEPIVNKVGKFTTSEILRLIVGQPESTIRFAGFLDTPGMTLLIDLAIGRLDEETTQALGMMLLSVLCEQIYERVRQRKEARNPIHLYIDEVGRFATSGTAISKLLKEGRKFNVGTTLAFQTFADLPDSQARAAVLQTGTLVSFQVIGGTDADVLAKQLQVKPQPGELLPKMRLEPNIKEWDEEVWDDEEAKRLYENRYQIIKERLKSKKEEVATLEAIMKCFEQAYYPEWLEDEHVYPRNYHEQFYYIAHPDLKKVGFSTAPDVNYLKPLLRKNGRIPIVDTLTKCRDFLLYSPEEEIQWLLHIKHPTLDLNGFVNRQKAASELEKLISIFMSLPISQAKEWVIAFALRTIEETERLFTELSIDHHKYLDEFSGLYMKHHHIIYHLEQDGWLPVKTEGTPVTLSKPATRWERSQEYTVRLGANKQIYDMIADKPRPFSDLWNEMQATLASLPPYNCYIQTINEQKEIVETRLETAPPPKKVNSQEFVDQIRKSSTIIFGRPADVVREEAETRIAPFLQPPGNDDESEGADKPKPKNPQKPPSQIKRSRPIKD